MKVPKSKQLILGIITLGGFLFGACQSDMFMNKYEWYPMVISTEGYPVRIDKGGFTYPDGGGVSINSRSEHAGLPWGSPGGGYIVGAELKPVPESFSIAWFSFLEKKYFEGSFKLPTEKIDSLFSKGYRTRLNRQTSYDDINIGVAPDGVIVVWLLGGGRRTEVGRYKAEEAPIPPIDELLTDSHLKTIDEYIAFKLNDLDSRERWYMDPDSIPYGKWDDYRKRYRYRQRIDFLNDEKLLDWQTDFYNGESFFIGHFDPIVTEYNNQAVPKYTHPNWIYNDSLYGAGIKFDETEIMEAFEKVYSNKDTKSAELVIKVNRFDSDLRILLQSDHDSVEIVKARTNVWHSEQ